MMAPDDDLTPSLLQAFTDRHLSMAPSGQFLAEQEASDAQAKDAERQTAARDWLRSQGLGDAIPSPADYDYGRMLDDGIYPSKDAAGRVPLPPQYWRPGRMLIGGRDIATGQRIASRVPLEDRILSGVEDDEPDDGDGISTLTQDDIAELSARERRGLEAWMESHGVMIAAGPSQTRTDAPTGYYPRPNRPPTLDDLKQRGTDVWDVLAGALKGGVAQTLGLPGDVESLIRMLTGGEQVMPTTEDMEKKLPPVIPPTLSSLVTGGGQREANAAYGETAGEFIGLGKAPTAVARGVVKGAKVLAPTAGDMARRGAEKVVDATGGRMRAVPDGGGTMTKPDISRIPGAADADNAVNEIERLSEQHGTVFIRWSRGPEHDMKTGASSRDFVSGQQHEGLSAIPIGSDMHPVDIARRLAEYGFLRMKDDRIRPFVYVGERVGTDSDGYALIRPTKKVAEISDTTIRAIDKGYAQAAALRDEIDVLESRSSRAQGSAKQIIDRDLVAAKQKLADLLENRAPATGAQPAMNTKKEYAIDHRPMTVEGGAAQLHDLTTSFGEDVYGPNALQFYGSGDTREKRVLSVLKQIRGKPDAMVTIYRGMPAGVGGKIHAGDWVTLDKAVAADYGPEVVSMQVPASHVTSWPDSLLEFGYYPPKAK